MQIIAGINARFFTVGEAFKPNDLRDAKHAALTLPYSDTFFCNSPLAHKLRTKPLQLEHVYNTKIINGPEKFLKVIANIEN